MQGRHNWAYRNLCSHLREQLPEHTHLINDTETADAVFVFCPRQLEKLAGAETIMHLDSNRWYEDEL